MTTNEKSFNKLVLIVWEYLQMHQKVEKSDCILALGSNDIRVAHRAADLFKHQMASYIVFSGGFGRLTAHFKKPEAEIFADEAIKLGVPKDKIIIENKSTNTGENIKFSMRLLKEKDLHPQSFILVTKPYMERRAYATFKKLQTNEDVIVTSPQVSFENSAYNGFTKDDVINIMIGDLQRIKIYPDKGFQIPQQIPEEVWEAYKQIVGEGYIHQLVNN